MTHPGIRITNLCLAAVLLLGLFCVGRSQAVAAKPLSIGEARLKVTGARHNRPDAYKGSGDFIGWPGGVDRMPNGDRIGLSLAMQLDASPDRAEVGQELACRGLASGLRGSDRRPHNGLPLE